MTRAVGLSTNLYDAELRVVRTPSVRHSQDNSSSHGVIVSSLSSSTVLSLIALVLATLVSLLGALLSMRPWIFSSRYLHVQRRSSL